MKKIVVLFLLIFITFACGKEKPPTGGPVDKTPPEIIDTEPQNLAKNYNKDYIEITFSEQISQNSFKDALAIFPPVLEKKISCKEQKVRIIFKEKLKINQTYHITIDTNCEDLRGNYLKKPYHLTFSSGEKIPTNSILTEIKYGERTPSYIGNIYVSLYYFIDTTLVTTAQVDTAKTHKFQYIKKGKYIIVAFKDKNSNKAIDYDREIYAKKIINLSQAKQFVELQLTLQDTINPLIKKISPISLQHLSLEFNEDIKDFGDIVIIDDSTKSRLTILDCLLNGQNLEIITSTADSIPYLLKIFDIIDFKDNITICDSIIYKNTALKDTTILEVLNISPEDGTTVSTLKPIFNIFFNKLVPESKLKFVLINVENDSIIDMNKKKITGNNYQFFPKNELHNYVPYKFSILAGCEDYEGNKLNSEIEINILPIIYEKE